MKNILLKIREDLRNNIDEKTRTSSQRFFKEKIKSYGVKAPTVNKICKDNSKLIEPLKKTDIFNLCELLWQSGYLEESLIACNWSYALHKQYEPNDFQYFEKWIDNYVNNWASCDTLCNHTVGVFLVMYPEYLSRIKIMAKSNNRWMRRASAVSLIIPARKGQFLKEIFELADILLLDKDDLVQKGYGWMLKSCSQAHQKQVFDYVLKNKALMPRTALRYAIEKMPKDMRLKAMEKNIKGELK
ncbi:MAG: DNA alkylation repair protein [Candidatus Cloacimonadales bacterium]|jgi:3-methyladenine DNA glycosylase AlkD|nr:DNA alkylation repair protein [Candidatus Cloacimonadota bacterium]MDD3501755.1 DNA alkylation repair protein [Candidatus Cloacimonadota bacterium]MDX9978241.1 DNA alkylation repair protein [Candidatus Cloacimonadales bacterium]